MTPEICDSSENLRLAHSAAAGDEQAFQELFSRFRSHLRRFIELRLDDRIQARVDPSDVLQETQIEVHRRLGDYLQRNPMPLRVWLRQTAKESLLAARDKHLRAAKRTVAREAFLNQQSSMMLARDFAAQDPTPSQAVAANERQQQVIGAIAQLREGDREILLMRNIEGLGFNEIAATLEISPPLARQRYGRAMLRLRKFLSVLDEDSDG